MGCLRGSTKRTRITIDIGVASTLPSPSYQSSFYSFSIKFQYSEYHSFLHGQMARFFFLLVLFIRQDKFLDLFLLVYSLPHSSYHLIHPSMENLFPFFFESVPPPLPPTLSLL